MDWSTLISAAAVIIVAIIEAAAVRERKSTKADKVKTNQRAEDRAKESLLGMKMIDAALELGTATALAVEQHKFNGELKRARAKTIAAQKEYEEFLQGVAVRQIAKV